MAHPEPPGYRLKEPRPKPKIGPYLKRIAQIIEEDKALPKKQRHTAKRIYERLREMGEIKINEYLQTSDPDIYAGGDCVRNIHLLTGKPVFAPMGSTANKHGRVMANNIMGYKEKFGGILGTAVVKVFDYNVGKSGLTEAQAQEAGFEVVTTLVPSSDIPHYYPTKKPLILKMIADRKTRKLLGIQGAGPGEVVKRIDVLAAAMSLGATIDDLPSFDLGYAPPYSTVLQGRTCPTY